MNRANLVGQHFLRCVCGGVTEVDNDIWLVSFMDNDLGFFDREVNRIEPVSENPFAPKGVIYFGVVHTVGVRRRIPDSLVESVCAEHGAAVDKKDKLLFLVNPILSKPSLILIMRYT